MKKTRLAGLHYWSEFQTDRHIDFNGWFWERSEGNVLIDPMPLTSEDLTAIRESGGAPWILVTSAEHLRAAPAIADALSSEILAPVTERDRFPNAGPQVHIWFDANDGLPPPLSDDIDTYALRGGKSPLEPCLHLRPLDALYFGDVVRSHVSGDLCLLPDPKLSSRDEVVRSLTSLPKWEPEAILLGDGDPILRGATQAWRTLLDSL